MKGFLFKTTSVFFSAVITAVTRAGNAVNYFIAFLFNSVNHIVSIVGSFLLKFIDPKRFEYNQRFGEQIPELIELNLLIAANRVKENAVKNKLWTSNDTMMINQIGATLLSRCGWEKARVHGYLKQVVESIPNMVYVSGDDYEEE